MNTVKPVFYKTPDGVERELRFTFGARKRIVDRFGMGLQEALNKYDAAALPELLYCCMYDEDGKAPSDLSLERFMEMPLDGNAPDLMASLICAASHGRAEKNEVEAQIRAQLEGQMKTLIGSSSGPSPISASGSQEPNSGDSQNESSKLSATDGERSNAA